MGHHIVFLGMLASLSIGCDRLGLGSSGGEPQETGHEGEPERAAAPGAVAEAITPTESASPNSEPTTDAVVGPVPTAIDPEPASQPVGPEPAAPINPAPPVVGKAKDVLAATLVGVAVPENPDIKDLRRRAWDDFLAERSADAGDAFTLLTKLDTKSWEFPYVAARAAARHDDMQTTQVFLVEALVRGGAEARTKASKEASFKAARKLPWFAELLAADAAGLADWVIRDPPPRVILDYEPGQAPATISKLAIATVPASGKRFEQSRLHVTFDIVRAGPIERYGGVLHATCRSGDRYLFDDTNLLDGDFSSAEAVVHIDVDMFHREWPEPRNFEACEVVLLGVDWRTEPNSYRRLMQKCWTGAGIDDGPCSDFARPISEEPQITALHLVPAVYGSEFGVFVEWVFGRLPDRDNQMMVRFACEIGDDTREGLAVMHYRYEFGQPGDAVESGSMVYLRGEKPSRCTLEVQRSMGGPRRLATPSVFCFEGGKTRPGACGS